MEIAGVVFRQTPCFSPTTADASTSRHLQSSPATKNFNSFLPRQKLIRKSVATLVCSGEFSDKSHLQYYNGPRMAVKEKDEIALKKKEMKKKMKLLKGLSKNLSTFSDMGFGLNPETGLDHQVNGQMISEATEVLLAQLQKLKAEKMESKKMKKEEKSKKKAARMLTECDESSSSESSDCDNIVNMKQLKTVKTPNSAQILEKVENRVTDNAISEVGVNSIVEEESSCSKRIEVCMGGKCKKSGAEKLLENFQAAVGGEAAVVGCKCMGKCRDGPNVRVRDENTMVSPAPLCIGVGLEDVDSIVSNFFGGGQRSSSDMLSPAF